MVRRSSSMMPILMQPAFIPSAFSASAKSATVKATSAGPCILGFTRYTLPVRLLQAPPLPLRSCNAPRLEHQQSKKPSGTGLAPAAVMTASVYLDMMQPQ